MQVRLRYTEAVMHDILFALWFLLPAACANVAPIFAAAIPALKSLNAPLDGGRMFRSKRVLGPHKTWRGLVSGILLSTIALAILQYLAQNFTWARDIAGPAFYPMWQIWLLGPLFAIGALGGDAIESFFKRQRGIESGETWLLFDQLDYIVGAILVSLPFIILSVYEYVAVIVVWFLIHLLSTYIGYLTGLKDKPI